MYGPWVGGISGAIGIFIRDMFVHGIPLLSLTAGVPPNFILFFLIGYIAHRNISLKQAIIGIAISAVALLVPMIVFLPNFKVLTGLSAEVLVISFMLTVVLSLVVIGLVAVRYKEWRSYAIAAVVGQAAGAGLLSATVWAVSPLFPTFFSVPIASSLILPIFVWTFATELPFMLLAGPPIIKACYRAFPSLRRKENQGTNIEKS